MNCHRARALLMAYLESELDGATTVAINRHLDRCEGCRARFEAEQRLELATAARLREPAERDQAMFERALAAARARRSRPRAGAIAALVTVVAALGWWLWPGEVSPSLVRHAVADHAKYQRGLMGPDNDCETEAELRAYLDGHAGTAFGRFPEGAAWRVVGPRHCKFDGVPVAYLLLQWDGLPVSLYTLRRDASERLSGRWSDVPSQFRVGELEVAVAAGRDAVRCAVGDVPIEILTRLVEPSQFRED